MRGPQDASEVVLALDIGGTSIKSAIFSGGKMTRRFPQIPSRSSGSRDEIAEAFRRALSQAGAFDRCAAALPGPFDYAGGVFRMTHKFGAVRDTSFRELTGAEALFLHDANAFLLGETGHGAGRGFRRVGGVTLGTGLGAACVADGRLLTDPDATPAKEVKLWNRPYKDGIGEDYVSARALLSKYPAKNPKEIEDAAIAGNGRARAVWREFASDLYALLAIWKRELSLDRIVLGGQLRKGLFLAPPAPEELNLKFSELGDDSALWGAYDFAS